MSMRRGDLGNPAVALFRGDPMAPTQVFAAMVMGATGADDPQALQVGSSTPKCRHDVPLRMKRAKCILTREMCRGLAF
jgi:hypothetical protein